jgi:hypothetical protein
MRFRKCRGLPVGEITDELFEDVARSFAKNGILARTWKRFSSTPIPVAHARRR